MGQFTNAGLTLVASAIQTPGVNCAITWIGISTGCGSLASALTSGVAYTSLALDAGIPANLASGVQLTVTDGINSETVTTSASVSAGATSLPVTSWTPTHSYAAHTSGVCPTPLATDTALYNETQRISANAGFHGATPGESINNGYFDGAQPSGLYLLVGYYGGSSASSTLGSGVLLINDVQVWNHIANGDSSSYQADTTL